MEVEMETEMEVEVSKPEPEMKVRKDYVPGIKPAVPSALATPSLKYQLCPKCGQQIPVDEMAEHLKIELSRHEHIQK